MTDWGLLVSVAITYDKGRVLSSGYVLLKIQSWAKALEAQVVPGPIECHMDIALIVEDSSSPEQNVAPSKNIRAQAKIPKHYNLDQLIIYRLGF